MIACLSFLPAAASRLDRHFPRQLRQTRPQQPPAPSYDLPLVLLMNYSFDDAPVLLPPPTAATAAAAAG